MDARQYWTGYVGKRRDSVYGSVVSEIECGVSALLDIGPVLNKTQSPVQIPGVLLAVIPARATPTVTKFGMCVSIRSYVLTSLSDPSFMLSCLLNIIQSVSYSEESIAFSSVV